MHEPATPEKISAFNRSADGSGPNPDDLHVDMRGKITSKWNIAVIQILLALVFVQLEEDSSWLPKVSEALLRTRIRERLEAARSTWRATQPKIGEDGKRETVQQVEDRVIREKTAKEAANRTGTRRITVSNFRTRSLRRT